MRRINRGIIIPVRHTNKHEQSTGMLVRFCATWLMSNEIASVCQKLQVTAARLDGCLLAVWPTTPYTTHDIDCEFRINRSMPTVVQILSKLLRLVVSPAIHFSFFSGGHAMRLLFPHVVLVISHDLIISEDSAVVCPETHNQRDFFRIFLVLSAVSNFNEICVLYYYSGWRM